MTEKPLTDEELDRIDSTFDVAPHVTTRLVAEVRRLRALIGRIPFDTERAGLWPCAFCGEDYVTEDQGKTWQPPEHIEGCVWPELEAEAKP